MFSQCFWVYIDMHYRVLNVFLATQLRAELCVAEIYYDSRRWKNCIYQIVIFTILITVWNLQMGLVEPFIWDANPLGYLDLLNRNRKSSLCPLKWLLSLIFHETLDFSLMHMYSCLFVLLPTFPSSGLLLLHFNELFISMIFRLPLYFVEPGQACCCERKIWTRDPCFWNISSFFIFKGCVIQW